METFYEAPAAANWWRSENLDNAQTGLHDHFMWLKYGFGRGCQQISVDVRTGRVGREQALRWVDEHDHIFPQFYAGVSTADVLDRIGMKAARLGELMQQFRNEAIHGAG